MWAWRTLIPNLFLLVQGALNTEAGSSTHETPTLAHPDHIHSGTPEIQQYAPNGITDKYLNLPAKRQVDCPQDTQPCHDDCIPDGGECCPGSGHCAPGFHCIIAEGLQSCCNSESCLEPGTWYFDGNDTSVQWEYYSSAVTWTFWATLIGYNATLSTALVTSTLRTTTVIITVLATDSADASISFDNFSASSTDTIPSTVTDSPSPTPSETSASDSPIPTASETSLSGPESSDRDTVDEDPGPSGAGDTGAGVVVVRPLFGASWGGVSVIVGMVMPLWMALYL